MSLKEATKEKLWLSLLSGLSGAIGWVLIQIVNEISDPVVKYVLPAIDKKLLLWLALLFLGTTVLAGALLLLRWGEREKSLMDRYEFLSDRGIQKNKKTGKFFCPNCLTKGMECPLQKSAAGTHLIWMCSNSSCYQNAPRLPEDG